MEPTQVTYPWRATARTVFQAFVGLCALLPLIVGTDVPKAGAVAVALSVSATVTRIMAIPEVNMWLERFLPWLSAEGATMSQPAHTEMRWFAILLVSLAVIVSGTVWVANRPAPQPPPPAPVAVPAPLPPATGIDGDGIAPGVAPAEALPDGLPVDPEQLPPDVQAQPDAGSPAIVIPGQGTGGEVFVRSPAWAGAQRLNASFRYPSGSLHAAWDIGINRGTKVFAAKDGLIVGKNDGVRNHPSGSAYAVSGSPSNWLLLCSTVNGKPAVLYYQHLSPGLKVKRGQQVKLGRWLARSGNTGNSTGDHLHVSSSFSPWACGKITPARAEYLRYDYLRTPSRRVFAPSVFWKATAKPAAAKPVVDASAVATACRRNGSARNVHLVRRAVGIDYRIDGCGPKLRSAYARYQRSLGFRGAAANGIPGYYSLTVLGKRGGFRVVR